VVRNSQSICISACSEPERHSELHKKYDGRHADSPEELLKIAVLFRQYIVLA
jgi:hypothetical protein